MTTSTMAQAEAIAADLCESFHRDIQRQPNRCIVCGVEVDANTATMGVQPVHDGHHTTLVTFACCRNCYAATQRPVTGTQLLRRIRHHILEGTSAKT